MTINKGIMRFGQPAIDMMIKEHQQFKRMTMFKRNNTHELTKEIKRCSLRAIDLIQQKKYRKSER